MKKLLFSLILAFVVLGQLSCSTSVSDQAQKHKVVTDNNRKSPRPVISKEYGYKMARGATEVQDISVNFDPKKAEMTLKGKLKYLSAKGDGVKVIDLDMSGYMNIDGYVHMNNNRNTPPGLKIGAKLTCLDDGPNCESSFVDLYLAEDDLIYHHQLTLQKEELPQTSEPKKEKAPPAKSPETSLGPALPKPDSIQTTPAAPAPAPAPEKDSSSNPSAPKGSHSLPGQNSEPKRQYDSGPHQKIPGFKKKSDPPPTTTSSSEEEEEEDHNHDHEGEEPEIETHDELNVGGEFVGTRAEDIQILLGILPEDKSGDKNTAPKPPQLPEPAPRNDDAPDKVEPAPRAPVPKIRPRPRPTPTPSPTPSPSPGPIPAPEGDASDSILNIGPDTHPHLFPRGEQASGSPTRWKNVPTGKLIRPTNILEVQKEFDPAGFYIVYPSKKTYYGTNEMAYMLLRIGKFVKKNKIPHVLAVNAISAKQGGPLDPHSSHRNGMDADIAYFIDNLTKQTSMTNIYKSGVLNKHWMKEKQWALFKEMVATEHVDRIFVGGSIKRALCQVAIKKGEVTKGTKSGLAFETLRRLVVENAHVNHFHLRLRCSANNPKCWQMASPEVTTGCSFQ